MHRNDGVLSSVPVALPFWTTFIFFSFSLFLYFLVSLCCISFYARANFRFYHEILITRQKSLNSYCQQLALLQLSYTSEIKLVTFKGTPPRIIRMTF